MHHEKFTSQLNRNSCKDKNPTLCDLRSFRITYTFPKIQGLSSGRNSTAIFRRGCHQNSVCWHTAAPDSNCSTYMFHMLVLSKDRYLLTLWEEERLPCSVSNVPRHVWLQSIRIAIAHPRWEQVWWCFRLLTKLLDATLDADLSPVLKDAFFSSPTKKLTGYRILACHIQHKGSLWLSDNNQLETQGVLKAQTAASQQMGLC